LPREPIEIALAMVRHLKNTELRSIAGTLTLSLDPVKAIGLILGWGVARSADGACALVTLAPPAMSF